MRSFIILIFLAAVALTNVSAGKIQPLSEIPSETSHQPEKDVAIVKAIDAFRVASDNADEPIEPVQPADYGCPNHSDCDWWCRYYHYRAGYCGGFLNFTCFCYLS